MSHGIRFMPCTINGTYAIEMEKDSFAPPKLALIGKISDPVDGTTAIPILVILGPGNLRPTYCGGVYLEEEKRIVFQEASIQYGTPHCRLYSGTIADRVINGTCGVVFGNLQKVGGEYKKGENYHKVTTFTFTRR